MHDDHRGSTRREAFTALASLGALPLVLESQGVSAVPAEDSFRNDWDFLVGRWNVQHTKRNGYLKGADWRQFDGTCTHLKTMAGQSNIEDYLINQTSGTYRALGVRAYDIADRLWSIWWIDSRYPAATLAPPVRGRFRAVVGATGKEMMFEGRHDGEFDDRKVITRFFWTRLSTSPRWEQAMSVDGGSTWETNWIMELTRAV